MRAYETMFIVPPTKTEEEAKEVLEEVKSIIGEKGEVTDVDEWGKREFAYEIEHFKEGYYFVLGFNAPPEAIAEIDRKMRLHDGILRHIIVRREEK